MRWHLGSVLRVRRESFEIQSLIWKAQFSRSCVVSRCGIFFVLKGTKVNRNVIVRDTCFPIRPPLIKVNTSIPTCGSGFFTPETTQIFPVSYSPQIAPAIIQSVPINVIDSF